MFICEATFAMLNRAAYKNRWEIEGIVTYPESSGTVDVKGAAMVRHRHSGPGTQEFVYGVVDYVGDADTFSDTYSVHFSRGSYDLSRGEALSEMDMRAQKHTN